MFGGLDLLMGVFVWLLVPETKGLGLEQMDELFGLGETAAKGTGDEAEAGRAARAGGGEDKTGAP